MNQFKQIRDEYNQPHVQEIVSFIKSVWELEQELMERLKKVCPLPEGYAYCIMGDGIVRPKYIPLDDEYEET